MKIVVTSGVQMEFFNDIQPEFAFYLTPGKFEDNMETSIEFHETEVSKLRHHLEDLTEQVCTRLEQSIHRLSQSIDSSHQKSDLQSVQSESGNTIQKVSDSDQETA